MIGIDWGSSGFRAYLFDDDGDILEIRQAPRGITTLRPDDYAAVLQQEIGAWLDQGNETILLSGMVGSRQGWREAGYVDCPARLEDIPAKLLPVEISTGRNALIVPGLACRTADGLPDVMRGEEIQIFGVIEAAETGMLCLPGTHSKHVTVEEGSIRSFTTAMTGEVFALMRREGLLAAMLPSRPVAFDAEAFRAGVGRSGQAGGLLHHLFGIRTRRLFDELAPDAAPDYFSGIVIGHELRGTKWTGSVFIVGAPDLAERYRIAFDCLGITAKIAPEHAAARGLHRLGRLLAGGRP